MRALLIAASPERPSARLIQALAADCDLVIAVDGGALALEAAGLHPDVYVGDADSLPSDAIAVLRSRGVVCNVHSAEKDASDLDLALSECLQRGCTHVLVSGALGGRLDHELGVIGSLLSYSALRPEIWTDSSTSWVLSAKGRSTLDLQGVSATFSVIALTDPTTVSVTGAHWELDHAQLEPLASRGLSNRVRRDAAEIVVHSGAALVVSTDVDAFRALRISD